MMIFGYATGGKQSGSPLMSLMLLEVIFEKEIDIKIKTTVGMHGALICIRQTPQKLLRKISKYFSLTPVTESCDAVQTGFELLISCLYLSNTGITDVHHAWLEGLNYIKVIWKSPSDEMNRQFPKEEKQMPNEDF